MLRQEANFTHTHRHTETHRQTDTDRHRQTHTDRQTDRHTQTDTDRQTHTHTQKKEAKLYFWLMCVFLLYFIGCLCRYVMCDFTGSLQQNTVTTADTSRTLYIILKTCINMNSNKKFMPDSQPLI